MCCESDQTYACGTIELDFYGVGASLVMLKPAAPELELEPLVPGLFSKPL
jgi:hypothetical protein